MNVPYSDLFLSQKHMIKTNVFKHAKHTHKIQNNTNCVIYYHLVVENFANIFANGLEVESFMLGAKEIYKCKICDSRKNILISNKL